MFTEEDYKVINRELETLKMSSLKRCANQEEFELVLKAFDFANEAHKGVRRRSRAIHSPPDIRSEDCGARDRTGIQIHLCCFVARRSGGHELYGRRYKNHFGQKLPRW